MAAWGIRGVSVAGDGGLRIDVSALDPDAPLGDPGLDDAPFTTLRRFLTAVHHRTLPIKLQVTGPLTLGMALRAAGAHDELAFRVARSAARARALSLLALARAEASEAPLVVVVDEPSLVALSHAEFPLAAEQAIDLTSSALATLEPHAVTGLHCCGAVDWRAVLETGPQVLSLPVGAVSAAATSALVSFLDRGGWIAWGAVPTDGPVGSTCGLLWRRLCDQWSMLEEAGADPQLVRSRTLVTPACGLAQHRVDQALRILDLTAQLACSVANLSQ